MLTSVRPRLGPAALPLDQPGAHHIHLVEVLEAGLLHEPGYVADGVRQPEERAAHLHPPATGLVGRVDHHGFVGRHATSVGVASLRRIAGWAILAV